MYNFLEMLKELMHSMGMSMVRERSVKSFLERIQTRKIVGWIELRYMCIYIHLNICMYIKVYTGM
jgi:hypothetical protein